MKIGGEGIEIERTLKNKELVKNKGNDDNL